MTSVLEQQWLATEEGTQKLRGAGKLVWVFCGRLETPLADPEPWEDPPLYQGEKERPGRSPGLAVLCGLSPRCPSGSDIPSSNRKDRGSG